MDWFDILCYGVFLISTIGIVIGLIKLNKMKKEKYIGDLVIAIDAYEDSPYVFMEFRTSPEELKNGEVGYVRVCRKNIS